VVLDIASSSFFLVFLPDGCLHRYQSTYMGSFQTVELIETFLNYQVRSDVLELTPLLNSWVSVSVFVDILVTSAGCMSQSGTSTGN
jgi:hypothetical protein